jgi:hypothetical protein
VSTPDARAPKTSAAKGAAATIFAFGGVMTLI